MYLISVTLSSFFLPYGFARLGFFVVSEWNGPGKHVAGSVSLPLIPFGTSFCFLWEGVPAPGPACYAPDLPQVSVTGPVQFDLGGPFFRQHERY